MEMYQLSQYFMRKYAQSQTAQPGDLQKVLTDAKLFSWNDVSKPIFDMLDKIEFQGKFDGNIVVDSAGNVKIQVTGSNPKNAQVQQGLQGLFGNKMTGALRTAKAKPQQTMTVPWLTQVG